MPTFRDVSEAQLREWVEANPGRVNDKDSNNSTPLHIAVAMLDSLSLVVWLVDERGADVNAWSGSLRFTPLHVARSVDIITVLLERGADPALLTNVGDGCSALTFLVRIGNIDRVARLLQYPRARSTVNLKQPLSGKTARHFVCTQDHETHATAFVRLLLQAGAYYISVTDINGQTPLALLRERRPTFHTTIALLEQAPNAAIDAEKASLLIKARLTLNASTTPPLLPLLCKPAWREASPCRGWSWCLSAGRREPIDAASLAPCWPSSSGWWVGPKTRACPETCFGW